MAKEEFILKTKIREYKKKYYLNQLLRGAILFIGMLLSIFLISTSVDFGLQPGTTGRTFIFFTIVLVLLTSAYWFIIRPISKIYISKNQISDEEAATQLGVIFPDLKDKLLNTIQLSNMKNRDNSLINASIDKRIDEISVFRFTTGIKFSANKKYLKYIAYPASILFILFLFIPQFLTESTVRIIKYNEDFAPALFFSLKGLENNKIAFKNEDYTVRFEVEGNIIPDKIYIQANKRRIKLENANDILQYTFKKVQDDFIYSIEAADYKSAEFLVKVYSRPDIKNFNINLDYPDYTKRNNETITNSGNITIPEGTNVSWLINTISSDSVFFWFSKNNKETSAHLSENQLFSYENMFFDNQEYSIKLKNPVSNNKNQIQYKIEVKKDKFPSLSVKSHRDTTLFSYLIMGGTVTDDYGVSKLELVYNTKTDGHISGEQILKIPISKNEKSQNYFYQWMLDSLKLNEGDELEYYVRVWDNDGINGSKFTKSGKYNFNLPSKKEIKEDLKKEAEGTKDKLNKTLDNAEELKEQIKDIQDKLKGKKTLDWQDKKQIEEMLKQKEKLQNDIKELKEKNKALNQKKERFSKPNEKLKEKVKQLQKLMDDLLDEETKKLYEELKKLLNEQKGVDEVQQKIDEIQNKEDNIEKEIERTLELFKRMQLDYKMEDIVNQLDNLEKEQSKLSEKTTEKENNLEQLQEKQDSLNEEFEDIKEDIDKLEELNNELKNPEQLDDTSEDEEEISEEQQKSSDQLNEKQRKKASESQKKATQKIQGLKKKMQQMQSSMEMEMLEENIENLKDIVDNLVKVSFDQESIMNDFKGVNQSDPRYVSLSQRQLKLRDDSKIIEDSLLSLAGRVFQIASFVTRELDAMNYNIESSLQALKDRKVPEAVSNQQFSMTSINNLALLLDDVLQQMQQQMSDASGNPKKGKKRQKQKIPGLSDLQKQLNQKIEDLKKGEKSGRQLSEELAKLAAEQEMIRQQLQEMEEKLNDGDGEGGNNIKDAIKKMEETEMDLVNKNITQQTIQRQKDILTRLLKSEDALRERELDKERESEKSEEINRQLPPEFEEYLKAKEKEVELLRTIPLKLNPYYKEEVNKYFKRLSEQ
ncbi:hypothetical protein [Reichenbachiella sp. MALMAid0571]|uniref:DUF4175 family protein n=1 Tax=Reichenbachiella sp. MALMAid0571 TaxID=3143939 RepID=UPI0032DED62C